MIVAVISNPPTLFCVALAAIPVIIVGAIGAAIVWMVDRLFFRSKHKKPYSVVVFVLLLPYLLAPAEARITPAATIRTVEDAVIINGSPEMIWNHIIRMETISPDEQRPSFYQTMGIPRPVKATLDHEGVGGIRQGEFEYGLMFHEEITIWKPLEAVAFEVDVMQNPGSTPVLRQIGGLHFDIIRAGYEIEARDESTVILHLHSQYRLSTNFNFYGVLWADWIMHDFQSYVLNTVKARVESN